MRALSLQELLDVYQDLMAESGGSPGIRDLGGIESALAQPFATFGGEDLYPTLAEKAAALGFSMIKNHAFVDGNKRIGHAAMETFLFMNGYEIEASVDEQEQIVLSVAAGTMDRDEYSAWVADHLIVVQLD
jgi:death-on-curing protein